MVDYNALLRPGFSQLADGEGAVEAEFIRELAESLMGLYAARAHIGEAFGHPKTQKALSAMNERLEAVWPTWRSALEIR